MQCLLRSTSVPTSLPTFGVLFLIWGNVYHCKCDLSTPHGVKPSESLIAVTDITRHTL
jgi:hypothetical protein